MKQIYRSKLEQRRETLKDFFGGDEREELSDELLKRIFQFEELMLKYRSAIRELTTKLEILGDGCRMHQNRIPLKVSSRGSSARPALPASSVNEAFR